MAIYGIDLGTTNSLIGLRDEYLSDLIPSVVNLETGTAGKNEYANLDAERSFKVNISLDSGGAKSVVASKYVLAELKRQVSGVKEVVISVPAYFTDNQRSATMEAASLVGLEVKALINEPTAAAIAISRGRKGLYLVFDLGGGTFDVSMIDTRYGMQDVQGTDGCIVGGDDLDRKILNFIAKKGAVPLHKLGRIKLNKLKMLACDSKVRIQKERTTIKLDLSEYLSGEVEFTVDEYKELMKLTFSDAIIRCKELIQSCLEFGEEYSLLFVGGSTRCPYLREWVENELGVKAEELEYDPDKIVAIGAAMYAQMIEDGTVEDLVVDVTKRLSIEWYDGTTETIIEKNSKLPIVAEKSLVNNATSSKLEVKLFQGDSGLAKNNECIGKLIYDYGREVKAMKGLVKVTVKISPHGIITLICKEILKPPVKVVIDRSAVNNVGRN